jgi:hypothetical protein
MEHLRVSPASEWRGNFAGRQPEGISNPSVVTLSISQIELQL